MRLIFVFATLAFATPAFAQQPAPSSMSAQQITEQIMENEISNYRKQLGQFAEQINRLTAERDELKKSCKK